VRIRNRGWDRDAVFGKSSVLPSGDERAVAVGFGALGWNREKTGAAWWVRFVGVRGFERFGFDAIRRLEFSRVRWAAAVGVVRLAIMNRWDSFDLPNGMNQIWVTSMAIGGLSRRVALIAFGRTSAWSVFWGVWWCGWNVLF